MSAISSLAFGPNYAIQFRNYAIVSVFRNGTLYKRKIKGGKTYMVSKWLAKIICVSSLRHWFQAVWTKNRYTPLKLKGAWDVANKLLTVLVEICLFYIPYTLTMANFKTSIEMLFVVLLGRRKYKRLYLIQFLMIRKYYFWLPDVDS